MNETTEEKVTSEEQSTPAPAASSTKQSSAVIWIVLAIVVALLGALVLFKDDMFGGAESATGVSVDSSATVARVNGETITRGELDRKLAQVKSTFPAGMEPMGDDAVLQDIVLNELINVRLLVAEAEAQEFSVSDEDVSAEIEKLIELFGGNELFQTQLEATGLTMDELRANMRNEILIRQLVDANTTISEVSVTDEELRLAYDATVAGGVPEEVPAFEEISDMLEAQLIQEKSITIINAYIDSLREGKDIELLL